MLLNLPPFLEKPCALYGCNRSASLSCGPAARAQLLAKAILDKVCRKIASAMTAAPGVVLQGHVPSARHADSSAGSSLDASSLSSSRSASVFSDSNDSFQTSSDSIDSLDGDRDEKHLRRMGHR